MEDTVGATELQVNANAKRIGPVILTVAVAVQAGMELTVNLPSMLSLE